MATQTLLLDVSGVIGDVRGTVSWKIKVALEEAELDKKYGIGFFDIARAYSTGGFDPTFAEYDVRPEDVRKFRAAWGAISEYPPGNVRIYPDVPFALNELESKGITVCFLTRLINENVVNILRELQRRGYKGRVQIDEEGHGVRVGEKNAIRVFNPQNDDQRTKDCKFISEIIQPSFTETEGPHAYVGDELERGPILKELNDDVVVIGCARGFFSRRQLETAYWKIVKVNEVPRLQFDFYEDEVQAREKDYNQKVFDHVITGLGELVTICSASDGGR